MGHFVESFTVAHLCGFGCSAVAKHYQTSIEEIDLLAKYGNIIAII
jgi:Holliday junction resolvase-like predicted endonuclease